ncbi:hypothetical protein chiPu_0021616 [Chiloscyllium punctatum]|uniref:Uncharacterized protein n=1 Tax=Chiloscyllium punctatum TaxID=137246 RepID=A0A401RIL2_CHIPU|nr:hypothetical protein [Chiloscyllium punctatum]
MEGNVVQTLRALGSPGPLVEEGVLCQAASEGPCSLHFTALCSWLASELKSISLLEECITPTTGERARGPLYLGARGRKGLTAVGLSVKITARFPQAIS